MEVLRETMPQFTTNQVSIAANEERDIECNSDITIYRPGPTLDDHLISWKVDNTQQNLTDSVESTFSCVEELCRYKSIFHYTASSSDRTLTCTTHQVDSFGSTVEAFSKINVYITNDP